MKEQEKISINGVPETMLQTMYARSKETKKKNAVIHDEKAVEIVEKLDYDFKEVEKGIEKCNFMNLEKKTKQHWY